MKFQKGHRLAKGRPPGSPNKRTVAFFEAIQDADIDPAKEMINIYNTAIESHGYGNREEKPIYLKIAFDAMKEITSYCYPKLKSVEHVKSNMLEGMTPAEKLEAMRQAVAMLEGEINKDGSELPE